ncbi:MAG: lipocalin family protein [Melioribacteraceae bacterium]
MIVTKKLALFLLLAFTLLSLPGCKTENPTDPAPGSLAGTWTLTKITIPNGSASIILTPAQAQIESTIIAGTDGTYTATIIDKGVTTTESGTYTTSGNKITFKMQDGTTRTVDYSLTGNKLVINQTISTPLAPETPAQLEFTRQ